MEFLQSSELPENFSYPPEFEHLVELGLVQLEPWWILEGDELRQVQRGLRERYPQRELVAFAARQDTDDVACWERANSEFRVVIVHDFASSGWEGRKVFPSFYSWFVQAIQDLVWFDTWPDGDPALDCERKTPSR